jgi:hypothetical protein
VHNKNKVLISDRHVIKTYEDPVRLECELTNIALFKDLGFLIPKVISYDKAEQTITLERVLGENYDNLPTDKLQVVITLLSEIYNKLGKTTDYEPTKVKYTKTVSENISTFCLQNNLSLNIPALNTLLMKLESDFVSSVFKDAKPANWVFQGDCVFMLDFDYVVPSYLTADLAQMLGYQIGLSFDSMLKYLNSFLRQVSNPNATFTPQTCDLFAAAVINSHVSSLKHNKNLPEDVRNRFTEVNIHLLKYLHLLN